MAEKICVGIRVRPLNQRELEQKQESAWRVDSKSQSLAQLGRDSQVFSFGATASASLPPGSELMYCACCGADHVFGEESSTEQVYEHVGRHVVHSAVAGVSGTIFACACLVVLACVVACEGRSFS